MACFYEPSPEQVIGYETWLNNRTQKVKNLLSKFDPWSLYHMRSIDKRVTVIGCDEMNGGSVMLRISISADYNLVVFERTVFGVDPGDLQLCDLPGQGEKVGFMGRS